MDIVICDSMRKMLSFSLIFLLLLSVLGKVQTLCLIKSLDVLELPHFQNRNSTNVLVSWQKQDNKCQDLGVKLSLDHRKFKACSHDKRDMKTSGRNITSGANSIILENLHHFSSYELTICPLLDCTNITSIHFETKESVPRVSAQKSSLDYDYKDTETSLTFNWRPPHQSQCDQTGAEAKFYNFKLVNLDREDDKYSHNGKVPENQTKIAQMSLEELQNAGLIPANQTQLTLEGLHPNSCYALFVFLTNSIGEFHQDFYIKVEKCTSPSSGDDLLDYHHDETTISLGKSGILILVVALSIIILVIISVIISRIMYKIRNKNKLRQKMRNYFGSCANLSGTDTTAPSSTSGVYNLSLVSGSENDYDSPSSRTRSPTDPLPPLLDGGNLEDVPGYSKLKRYKIYKPFAFSNR